MPQTRAYKKLYPSLNGDEEEDSPAEASDESNFSLGIAHADDSASSHLRATRQGHDSSIEGEPYHAQHDQVHGGSPRDRSHQRSRPSSPTRSPRARKPNDSSQEFSWPFHPIVVAIVIAFLVILGPIVYPLLISSFGSKSATNVGPGNAPNVYLNFTKDLQRLSETYASQDRHVWLVIRAAVKEILENRKEPESPAVILVAGCADSSHLVRCFVRDLGNLLFQLHGKSEKVSAPLSLEGGAKLATDRTLTNYFTSGGRVVILQNIDKWPSGSVTLLHAFCDNFHAPVKNAVFLAPIQLTSCLRSEQSRDKVVEKHLTDAWEAAGLDADRIGALLSRVAQSIIVISADKDRNDC